MVRDITDIKLLIVIDNNDLSKEYITGYEDNIIVTIFENLDDQKANALLTLIENHYDRRYSISQLSWGLMEEAVISYDPNVDDDYTFDCRQPTHGFK
jgi:hypothetical protein